MNLFHVSKYPNLKTLIPKVPVHWATRHGLEEGVTARVSFATSIDRCLRAVQSKPNTTFYVYVPVGIDKQYLRRPSIREVPDARLTNEYWYLKPVNVRLYGVIKSGKLIDARIYKIGYPEVSTIFGLSHGREYEMLKRYNKNGKEITIRTKVTSKPKSIFGRDSGYKTMRKRDGILNLAGSVGNKLIGSGSSSFTAANERQRAKEWRRGFDEYDEDEDEQRDAKRRRERQKTKKKIRVGLAKLLLARIF